MRKIDEKELKEIFNSIKNNRKDSVEIFYKNYYSLIYGIAFSILKNKENSEDVTQDVFTKILKLDSDKFPTQGEASWLYTVTKNEAIQFLRKQKKNVDIDELYSLESESDEIDDIVDMNSYYKLIEDLQPLDQEIISLRILSDFTFDKIAQMKGMSIGKVQWRYYQAIHSIKLSISNLAGFLIAFSIWQTTRKFSFSGMNSSASLEDDSNEFKQSSESVDNYVQGGFSTTFEVKDSSGAGVTMDRVKISMTNIVFACICLFFIIFTIFFLIRSRVKTKKQKKDE